MCKFIKEEQKVSYHAEEEGIIKTITAGDIVAHVISIVGWRRCTGYLVVQSLKEASDI